MEITNKYGKSEFIRLSIETDTGEIAHAYLFLITNDLRSSPYGLLEDVSVEESFRRQGLGTEIVNAVITEAKLRGCYKLIATSRYARPEVHEWYQRLGFKDYGKEFRMNF